MRTVSAGIRETGIAPQQLAVLYLHRNQTYGLGFYLGGLSQEWRIDGDFPEIHFVAAREDLVAGQVHPGARQLSWFPGQRIRLWTLLPDYEIVPPATASLSK
jgi:hypothetical protein